jgi:hypothetical protein
VQATDEQPRERKLPSHQEEEVEEEKENSVLSNIFASPPLQPLPSDGLAGQLRTQPVMGSGSVLGSVDLEAAFEKMASAMILMTASGDRETTLFLDGAHFSNSCLFGTQITIREFSTAPKAFNIEILSNAQGAAMIDAGKSALLLSFQKGHFQFTVHRLETLIQQGEDRPVLHRKESDDGQNQEQKGEDQP